MRVIAVDDEPISLECLEIVLSEMKEIDNIKTFLNPKETLKYVENNIVDIAFLDIEMNGMNGLILSTEIKKRCPNAKIIFVTSSPKYAFNAIQLHVNGYVVKPVTKEAIKKELDFIAKERNSSSSQKEKNENKSKGSKLYVKAFGNFEVFADGKPVKFFRSKSKELFAYLIDRKGSNCSVGELCAVLWENRDDDEALQSQLRKVISDLKKTLESIGFENVLIKSRGYVAILPDYFECDYYNFLNNISDSHSQFNGEYMNQYSWGENTLGYLERMSQF